MVYLRLINIIELLSNNNKADFATKVNVAATTVLGYLKEEGNSKIRVSFLEKVLGAFPQVSRDWLFFGEGEMLKSAEPPQAAPALPEAPPSMYSVPLIGFASCSSVGWHGTMTIPVPVEQPTWYPGMVAVMASGESMLPAGIGHGHICYCDPAKAPGMDEAVYVETVEKQGTIKLFCGWTEEGGGYFLHLRGWHDKQPGTAEQEPMHLLVPDTTVSKIAPVIYVRRRL